MWSVSLTRHSRVTCLVFFERAGYTGIQFWEKEAFLRACSKVVLRSIRIAESGVRFSPGPHLKKLLFLSPDFFDIDHFDEIVGATVEDFDKIGGSGFVGVLEADGNITREPHVDGFSFASC